MIQQSHVVRSSKVRRSRKLVMAQLGLTLIELMIGVVLGIVLVTGVVSIFTSNQQSFNINSDLARLQESARFAYEQMNREIRDAGTNPCGVRAVNSVVRTSSATIPWWGDWNAGTLRGYDGNEAVGIQGVSFGASIADRVTGTDALIVLRTVNDDGQLRSVTNHTNTNQVSLNTSLNFSAQDVAFMCDSASGAIFEVTTVSSTPAPRIDFDTSAPSSNCSTSLGWANNVNCNANAVSKTFAVGSLVTKFDPAIWYVGLNSNGQRALFRETLHKQSSPSAIVTTEKREFVPDVNDMQIQYLLRTKSADPAVAPTLASNWVDASVINGQTGTWSATNPNEAVAVRIVLTFRSDSQSGINAGGTATQALERNTVSVISLRNRELVR